MAFDLKLKPESGLPITLVSTELNSLAAGAWAVSSLIDVDATLNLWVNLFLFVTFASAPTADSPIYLYMADGLGDGTTEDVSATGPILPPNGQCGIWRVRAVTTAQVIGIKNVRLPGADYKLAIGNGTNQAFPASGSTIKAVPTRYQIV